jgi:hypothetical protein
MKIHLPTFQITRRLILWPLAGWLALVAGGALHAAPLVAEDEQFLSAYVHIHDALVANDMTGVRKAAAMLPASAETQLANAGSIHSARDGFAKLTPRAEKLAAGQPEYHIFYCPMAKLDWVQKSTAIQNPYLGPDMRTCGVQKK